jgi:hypothetical protein
MGLPLEGLCKKARVGEGEIQRGPKISSQSGFSPTFPLPTICTDRLQQLAGKRLKGSKLQIVLSHSRFRPGSQTAAAPYGACTRDALIGALLAVLKPLTNSQNGKISSNNPPGINRDNPGANPKTSSSDPVSSAA